MPPRVIGAILVAWGVVVLFLLALAWPPTAAGHGGPGRTVPKTAVHPAPVAGHPTNSCN